MSSLSYTPEVMPEGAAPQHAATTRSRGRGNQAAIAAAGLAQGSDPVEAGAAGTEALVLLGDEVAAALDAMPLAEALRQALANLDLPAVAAWLSGLGLEAVAADEAAVAALYDALLPVGRSVELAGSIELGAALGARVTGSWLLERLDPATMSLTITGTADALISGGIGGAVGGAAPTPIIAFGAGVEVGGGPEGWLAWWVPLAGSDTDALGAVRNRDFVGFVEAMAARLADLAPSAYGGELGIACAGGAEAALGLGGSASGIAGLGVAGALEVDPATGRSEYVVEIQRSTSASCAAGLAVGLDVVVTAMEAGQSLEVRFPCDAAGAVSGDPRFRLVTVTGDAQGQLTTTADFEDVLSLSATLLAATLDPLGLDLDAAPETLSRAVEVQIDDASTVVNDYLAFMAERAPWVPLPAFTDVRSSQRLDACLEVGPEAVAAACPDGEVGAREVQAALVQAALPSQLELSPMPDGLNVDAGLAASKVKSPTLTLSLTRSVGARVDAAVIGKAGVAGDLALTESEKIDLEIADAATLAEVVAARSLAGVAPVLPTPSALSASTAPSTGVASTAQDQGEVLEPEAADRSADLAVDRTSDAGAASLCGAVEPATPTSQDEACLATPLEGQEAGDAAAEPRRARRHHPVRPGPFGRSMQVRR